MITRYYALRIISVYLLFKANIVKLQNLTVGFLWFKRNKINIMSAAYRFFYFTAYFFEHVPGAGWHECCRADHRTSLRVNSYLYVPSLVVGSIFKNKLSNAA